MARMGRWRWLAVLLVLAGCCPAPAPAPLAYLGQQRIASAASFAGTVIGGLSGISYDPGRGVYYVISDDRSEHNPARFYTVRIPLFDKGIDAVEFIDTHPLRDTDGRPFARWAVDGEGIAFDSRRQRLYWISEGERTAGSLIDPFVRIAGLDGAYLGQFALPAGLAMSDQRTGPRRNKALEGLTLTPDGRYLFAAMEEPGYQDGEPADQDHGALTRITQFDVETRAPLAQYTYRLEPVPAGAEANGTPDLVALDDTTFLVLEKAGTARPPVTRVFRAEIGGATDVLGTPSLPGAAVTPMTKTLLVDLSARPAVSPRDNIEGITLGPMLPDGRQAVLMVSDDNFNPYQLTQFLLFAM